MNAQELLTISKQTATVAFHKFVLLCSDKTNDLFCFFEGKDSQYYYPRIRQFADRNFHPISCGNKSTVISTFEIISKSDSYKKFRTSFFIDRDFDSPINIDSIYETPCYSIENFYVNKWCLSEILKNEFGLTENSEEYNQLISLFEEENRTYCEHTLLFNAWYASLKKKKRELSSKSTNVNLDEKIPATFICVKIGNICSNYDLNKIKLLFPDSLDVTYEEVVASLNDLKENDLNCVLRGKFQIHFFYTFLQYIINDANVNHKILKKKTSFRVDKALIHSQLCQYAITPECLKSYLIKFN